MKKKLFGEKKKTTKRLGYTKPRRLFVNSDWPTWTTDMQDYTKNIRDFRQKNKKYLLVRDKSSSSEFKTTRQTEELNRRNSTYSHSRRKRKRMGRIIKKAKIKYYTTVIRSILVHGQKCQTRDKKWKTTFCRFFGFFYSDFFGQYP